MTITIPDEFVRAKLASGGVESPAAAPGALFARRGREVYQFLDRDEADQGFFQAIDSPSISLVL